MEQDRGLGAEDVATAPGLEPHGLESEAGGTGSVNLVLARSLGCMGARVSSLSWASSMFSGEHTADSWATEDSLWSRQAGERVSRSMEERTLGSKLVQLPSVEAIRSAPYGTESEPCTSREHRSSEEQLWSGTSASSDTISEALSTDAARITDVHEVM